MAIVLSKEDTFSLIHDFQRRQHFQTKYRFVTEFPWCCLKCLSPIYISYKQFSNIAIFCPDCKAEANNSTPEAKIVQFQCMRVVKERQLELIESFLNKINLPINDE